MRFTQIAVACSLAACLGPRALLAENPGDYQEIRRSTARAISTSKAEDLETKGASGGQPGDLGSSWRIADLKPLAHSPVPGVESSGYGWRQDPVRRRKVKFHKGRDYRAPKGTPVYAAGAGTVIFAGRQHGYGRVIYIDHGDGLTTRYAHLSVLDAKKGDAVGGGVQVGEVGASGRATGNHLHFEVRIDGRAIDPVAALRLAELQRSHPGEANRQAIELAPDVQDDLEDEHSPPAARPDREATAAPAHRPDRPSAKTKAQPGGKGTKAW